MKIAKSAPTSWACRVSSIVSRAEWWAVWAMTLHLPRASSTTTSTERRRSFLVKDQNSPMIPVQKTPSMCRLSVKWRMLARSPASSRSPSAVKGVVMAAQAPENWAKEASLASDLR
jgi:hypothetical protein